MTRRDMGIIRRFKDGETMEQLSYRMKIGLEYIESIIRYYMVHHTRPGKRKLSIPVDGRASTRI